MKHTYTAIMLVLVAVVAPAALSGSAYEDSLQALLPAAGEIEGWQRDGEHLIYYADELWEYINGAAEGFLAYEVKAVIVQDYVDADGNGLKFEIYDHQTPLMGFGIYAQHRDPSLEFLEIGSEAFGDEYSLHFWKGRYYGKINVFSADGEAKRAMSRFAESVAGRIPDGGPPAALAAFPAEGLMPRSIALLTEGVLGRSRFPSAFVGSYEAGGSKGRLYLFPAETEEAAAELLAWYAGEIGVEVSGKEAEGFSYTCGMGADPYQGEVAIFKVGAWAGVVTGFEDSEEARRAVVAGAVRGIMGLQGKPLSPSVIKLAPAPR